MVGEAKGGRLRAGRYCGNADKAAAFDIYTPKIGLSAGVVIAKGGITSAVTARC